MTRSRLRKIKRDQARLKRSAAAVGPFAAALAIALPSRSQESADAAPAPTATEPAGPEIEELFVTAQKREENVQDVPMSITAFGSQELEDLGVADFKDYAAYLPSLSYVTSGPGASRVFFRGVSSGDNGNHSGSQPTVGQYLDEQPITTILGAPDLHIYDIARIEALAGPQGTLYGASSQAGTIRIITNKPRPGEFEASYDVGASITDGKGGLIGEGMVNVPIGDRAAIRLVGWAKRDPGYISNVPGTRTFPNEGVTVNNASRVEDDYNDVDTYGGRVALRVDLNDSWTLTPTFMGQLAKGGGQFSYDPSVGTDEVQRYRPEDARDGWYQAALTVEGSIANFDVVYAGAYMKRNIESRSDYSDYSFFYDLYFYDLGNYYGSPYYVFFDDTGTTPIDPTQYINAKDRFSKQSHELRIASPADWRLRFVAGAFYQRQQHRIEQNYMVAGMEDAWEVTGWGNSIWLTEQKRVDTDYAIFGEMSFDITEKLTATGGIRLFRSDNSLEGYFGFGDGVYGGPSWISGYGEQLCSILAGDAPGDTSSWEPYTSIGTAPCKNLDAKVEEDDYTPKVNVTYRFDDDRLAYFTWSKGFRPGGVNRRGTYPPYQSDFLTNYEVGFKSGWADGRLRLNGAFFWEQWDDFQYSFLGAAGLTNITNAGGARIWGIETDAEFAVTEGLMLSGAFTWLDGELTDDFCEQIGSNNQPLPPQACIADDPNNFAPEGTGLPIVPDYKLNMTARYTFDIREFEAFLQGSLVTQGDSRSALLEYDEDVYGGKLRAYTLVDFAAGFGDSRFHVELYLDNAFDERADISRYAQCTTDMCTKGYIVTNPPRTFGIRFGQSF